MFFYFFILSIHLTYPFRVKVFHRIQLSSLILRPMQAGILRKLVHMVIGESPVTRYPNVTRNRSLGLIDPIR